MRPFVEVDATKGFTSSSETSYKGRVDQVLPWTEADVVRKLRAETGITLKRLAKESGVALKTINRLEMGHTEEAKRATLMKLARVFGMTQDEFFAAIPRRQPGPHVRVPDAKIATWREERKRRRQRRIAVGQR